MSVLSDFNLVLPQVPSEDEWIEYIESTEGRERDISTLRAKGYNLLADLNERHATYERVGWLSLWAKVMAALESMIPALHSGSDLILESLSRATFEWLQHQLAITDPIHDLLENRRTHKEIVMTEYAYRSVVDRLRAYTAWCLWSDKNYYQELIDPRTQKNIWDSGPAREILQNAKKLQSYERFYGPLDSEIDENKLRQGRRNMEALYREKIRRIEDWLGDTKVKHWSNKLKDNYRSRQFSFFSLFGEDSKITERLHKYQLRFAYTSYSEGSMALHGSTIDQFMHIGDSVISPKIQISDQVEESLFEGVISNCNHVLLALAVIDHLILKKPGLRE